jgi:hypothetical protein
MPSIGPWRHRVRTTGTNEITAHSFGGGGSEQRAHTFESIVPATPEVKENKVSDGARKMDSLLGALHPSQPRAPLLRRRRS